MKTIKLMTIIPLAAALTTGLAHAQGNPHQDMIGAAQQQARFQGNPHLGFEVTQTRYVERYRGNPHEGQEFKVVRIAEKQGNPHTGFEIMQLSVASR
jgi:hypothetical protein